MSLIHTHTKIFGTFFSRLLAAMAIVMLATGCTSKIRKDRAMRRAENFYQEGEYDKAKIEYTNALRLDQKDPLPFERIGMMWLEEGVPLKAGPFLVRAQELAPSRPEIKTKLAEVYISIGGLADARKEATDALQVDPGNESAILVLADASRTPEELAEVEELLKKSKPDTANYFLTKATLALRRSDAAAVEPALRKAIAADLKLASAHLALARYKLVARDFPTAGAEMKQAAELGSARATGHLLYAEFLAQTGKIQEAKAYIEGVVKKAPDFLPAWTLLAKYVAQKNYDDAIKLLENVFRRDNQNFDARMLESEFYLSKGDAKKAIEALKQLETNYPKIPVVKYQLARAYLQSGDGNAANSYLDQALTLAPDYGDATLLQAEVNLRSGNPAAVVPAMEEYLKKMPSAERGQVLLADALRAMGQFDQAAAIFRKQIEVNPLNAQSYLMLGALARQQGKTVEARAALEKAADLATDKLPAVNQLLEMDMLANDFPAARKRVSDQLARTPDSAPLYLLQGKIYAAQRNFNLAEAALLKVIQLNADIPSAYELLVSVYVADQKVPEAISQLESFIAKTPNNSGALMTLALIYTENKNYEKARDTYETLLAARPDIAMAMNNLAYIYSDNLNQLDKARDWAAKARTVDPGNPSIADTYGWILYRLGDYKQAASVLKESAEKLANQPEVLFHAGMANYMMGDSKAARGLLEAAVNAPEDFSGKEEARKRLAMIAEGKGAEFNIEQLEAMLKQQPNDPMALANLAEAYANQGAPEKAAATYEQAIKINPTLAGATIKLAQLYAGPLKKKERALELAKKARELAPSDARSAGILGKLAFEAGNQTWAYSLLSESARAQADNPQVLRDYAMAAYALGKVTEARRIMEKVVTAAPDSSPAQEAKTFLAFTNPEATDAESGALEADAERVLKGDPTNVPATMVQANAQAKRGEKAAAISSYNNTISRYPEFGPAEKELAALYLSDPNNRSKAYELATSARKTMPEDPELAGILGEASYYRKDYSRALQYLQESNRKKPLAAQRLALLGLAQLESKQVAAGRETLQKATTMGLAEPLAAEVAKALQDSEPKEK